MAMVGHRGIVLSGGDERRARSSGEIRGRFTAGGKGDGGRGSGHHG